jgi:hypothetical protein
MTAATESGTVTDRKAPPQSTNIMAFAKDMFVAEKTGMMPGFQGKDWWEVGSGDSGDSVDSADKGGDDSLSGASGGEGGKAGVSSASEASMVRGPAADMVAAGAYTRSHFSST